MTDFVTLSFLPMGSEIIQLISVRLNETVNTQLKLDNFLVWKVLHMLVTKSILRTLQFFFFPQLCRDSRMLLYAQNTSKLLQTTVFLCS